MDNEDKTLINFNPELNQSGIFDNEGNRIKRAKQEQFDSIPRGFIDSGLIFYLEGKDIALYFFLSSKCNKWRNTRVTNDFIIKNTGLKNATINRSLKRLELLHFISRRKYYIRPKVNRRIITLLRWDTAQKKIEEKAKIKAKTDNDILHNKPL